MTLINKNNIVAAIIFILFFILQLSSPNLCFAKTMQKQNVIYMEDDYFTPESITINAGQTVTWINRGEKVHTVTSADRTISSGKVEPGGHFSYTFNQPGDYVYYCHEHSIFYMGMKGKVIVK